MKKLYMASKLRIFVALFLLLNFLTIFASLTAGSVSEWHWIFALATILVAGTVIYYMRAPFHVLAQVDTVLREMYEGKFDSRITQVAWMGEPGHIAWNLNDTLDQLEAFF